MKRLEPKVYKYSAMLLVVIVGTVLLSALLSVRSWYKPSIKINDISPVSIVLEKDVKVIDKFSTQEQKKLARLTAIQNIKNKEILEVDKEAQKNDLEKLKFIVQTIRNSIIGQEPNQAPLSPSISIEVQNLLLRLDDDRFNQVLLSKNFEEIKSDLNFLHDDDLRMTFYDEISSLNEIELRYFLDGVLDLRKNRYHAIEIKQQLGSNFIERLRLVDYEDIFSKTFAVQKKLLDIGIVRGLPKSQIHSMIKILYPGLSASEREIIQTLIDISTTPNIIIDWKKVEELEKEAMDAVEPVEIELKAGALLAEKGKVVELQSYYYLEQLDMLHAETDWKEIFNNLTLMSFFVIMLSIAVFTTSRKKYTINHVLMVYMVTVVISAIIALITVWGVDKLALVPLATVSILLTVFYSPSMASIAILMMCFFMVRSIDMNFWQILPQLIGSLYAIFLVRRAHQREDLANAGTKIAIAQIVAFLLTLMLAVEDFKVTTVLIVASFYGIGAILSGFLSLAALPYLESGLKLITPFKLAELSNPNQALLKRLKDEAPGTYQHSLNVSRLSEEASNLLNLNTELLRVGLLYHDIGKMHAPDYFIENNLGKPNPHTTLDDPLKSAEIIIAHVPEGIKLAKKYNLPQVIIDFIPMHQGKTITNYFYYKAKEKFGEKNVNPDDFRYPGPKPNSKETGVAMIADSTEAALRSIKDIADEAKAREMIYKIINARVAEGELDESGLTNNDLETVAEAFLNVWRSQNHERIKYPEKQAG
jgi:cyclic-di-AMP phosphodiesterase PgpH